MLPRRIDLTTRTPLANEPVDLRGAAQTRTRGTLNGRIVNPPSSIISYTTASANGQVERQDAECVSATYSIQTRESNAITRLLDRSRSIRGEVEGIDVTHDLLQTKMANDSVSRRWTVPNLSLLVVNEKLAEGDEIIISQITEEVHPQFVIQKIYKLVNTGTMLYRPV